MDDPLGAFKTYCMYATKVVLIPILMDDPLGVFRNQSGQVEFKAS